MKKVTKTIPAKINLTLDVLGLEGKYHQINSLVASVDVYDVVTVKKRKDKKITLTMKGLPVDCPIEENNAFKTASYFMQKFSTDGVDIIVDKKIPVGAGLGGSSADIAGVLLAMKELYEVVGDLQPLASKLGSDSVYMLKGGYAVMSGRGEKVEKKYSDKRLYLLAVTDENKVSAKECYKKFDQSKKHPLPTTKQATKALELEDVELFYKLIKNDLEGTATKLVPETAFNLSVLKHTDAEAVFVAGSGPTALAIYKSKTARNLAYKKVYPLFDKKLLKLQTIPDKKK